MRPMSKKQEKILITKMLNLLIKQLKIDLKNHNFFLVNEHDLQAYLYMKLVNGKLFNEFIIDGDGDENYRIHCEYARGEYIKGEGTPGRHQFYIAILKEDLNDNQIWYTKKPVWLGMELKLNIDASKKAVIDDIDKEDVAIEITKKNSKFAEWAVLFHLNIAKKKYSEHDFNDIKEYIYKLKKKNKKTFYVYLETYKNKNYSNFAFV